MYFSNLSLSISRHQFSDVNRKPFLNFRGFKKRAPRAVKEIKKFALQMMGTADVRLDTRLNKAIWSRGIR